MFGRSCFRGGTREWLTALCAYALLVAPFGCEVQSLLLNDGDDSGGGASGLDTTSSGLFINSDDSSNLLAAGRDARGDAFYVFGTRDAQGGLREIESILVQTADGGSSFIAFESGRPVLAEGPDGSYVHITYAQVSSSRLAATAELYDARAQQKSSYVVDVDLEQSAAQIAELVETITGRELKAPSVAGQSKSKDDGRSLRITIFSPLFVLFVIPLVVAVQATIVVLGQVLAAIFAAVAATIQAALLAALLPLFLISGLLGDVLIRIEFLSLFDVFDALPPPPLIVLI
jgi:hypothetical protein